MNETLDRLHEESQSLVLTSEERKIMRESIEGYINNHPIRTELSERPASSAKKSLQKLFKFLR